MVNVFTVDLEDWFVVSNLSGAVPRDSWPQRERRLAVGARKLLDILARFNVRATFFVLGYTAEQHPDIVRSVRDAGHEIATHGYGHQRITEQSPAQFEEDLTRSLEVISSIAGVEAKGGYGTA